MLLGGDLTRLGRIGSSSSPSPMRPLQYSPPVTRPRADGWPTGSAGMPCVHAGALPPHLRSRPASLTLTTQQCSADAAYGVSIHERFDISHDARCRGHDDVVRLKEALIELVVDKARLVVVEWGLTVPHSKVVAHGRIVAGDSSTAASDDRSWRRDSAGRRIQGPWPARSRARRMPAECWLRVWAVSKSCGVAVGSQRESDARSSAGSNGSNVAPPGVKRQPQTTQEPGRCPPDAHRRKQMRPRRRPTSRRSTLASGGPPRYRPLLSAPRPSPTDGGDDDRALRPLLVARGWPC